VVIGGGYIGLEVAACMNDMGKSVTVIEMADRLLARVATPEMSAFFARLHESKGVSLITGESVDRIEGRERVEGVVTTGGTRVDAGAAVVGIGVIPDLELLSFLGEEDVNGVTVDQNCLTRCADVYAVGDIAKFEWPFASMRIESIHNAQYTAAVAAHHALGIDPPKYEHPWFWSDQYGGKLQTIGVPMDWDQIVWRDGNGEHSGAAFAFRQCELISVEAFNLLPAFMLGKKIIAGSSGVTMAEIEDPANDLRALIKRKDH